MQVSLSLALRLFKEDRHSTMCERKEPDNPAPGTFITFSERVYFTFLTKLINAFFKVGNLTISFKDLPSMKLGDGSGEAFLLHFRDKSDLVRMLYKPSLNIGEVFMDGGWSLEQGDLGRFMGVLLEDGRGTCFQDV